MVEFRCPNCEALIKPGAICARIRRSDGTYVAIHPNQAGSWILERFRCSDSYPAGWLRAPSLQFAKRLAKRAQNWYDVKREG